MKKRIFLLSALLLGVVSCRKDDIEQEVLGQTSIKTINQADAFVDHETRTVLKMISIPSEEACCTFEYRIEGSGYLIYQNRKIDPGVMERMIDPELTFYFVGTKKGKTKIFITVVDQNGQRITKSFLYDVKDTVAYNAQKDFKRTETFTVDNDAKANFDIVYGPLKDSHSVNSDGAEATEQDIAYDTEGYEIALNFGIFSDDENAKSDDTYQIYYSNIHDEAEKQCDYSMTVFSGGKYQSLNLGSCANSTKTALEIPSFRLKLKLNSLSSSTNYTFKVKFTVKNSEGAEKSLTITFHITTI